jgi:hypothetical protein
MIKSVTKANLSALDPIPPTPSRMRKLEIATRNLSHVKRQPNDCEAGTGKQMLSYRDIFERRAVLGSRSPMVGGEHEERSETRINGRRESEVVRQEKSSKGKSNRTDASKRRNSSEERKSVDCCAAQCTLRLVRKMARPSRLPSSSPPELCPTESEDT